MRTRVYLRVGKQPKGKPLVKAGVTPSHRPLTNSRGYEIATVAFALDIELPDVMFKQAEQVIATLTIPPENAAICADIRLVEPGAA